MRRNSPLFFIALLTGALLLAGCNPNPTPEEACAPGPNGGNPVIIVAGTFSPAIANELFLGNSLQAAGFTHCVFELKGSDNFGNLPGTMPIDISAVALSLFVDEVLEWAGATEVDLVGHSQGALAARAYVKSWGGAPKVDKLVSLAGPNDGTDVVPLVDFLTLPLLAPFGVTCDGVWPCVQMRRGSDFLTDLNSGGMTPAGVDYYAFYTNNDELVWYWGEGLFGLPVIKFDNATLGPGATNIEIGEMCPLRIVGHLGMILDPVPIHMTIDALRGDPVDVPLALCLLPPVPV
ncbi:MAG: lipase [Halioglobus sp.]|nr:lipase [Halioglobus sp.]